MVDVYEYANTLHTWLTSIVSSDVHKELIKHQEWGEIKLKAIPPYAYHERMPLPRFVGLMLHSFNLRSAWDQATRLFESFGLNNQIRQIFTMVVLSYVMMVNRVYESSEESERVMQEFHRQMSEKKFRPMMKRMKGMISKAYGIPEDAIDFQPFPMFDESDEVDKLFNPEKDDQEDTKEEEEETDGDNP